MSLKDNNKINTILLLFCQEYLLTLTGGRMNAKTEKKIRQGLKEQYENTFLKIVNEIKSFDFFTRLKIAFYIIRGK